MSPAELRSSLARVRRMSSQLDERDRPFSPERPGTWRGSSRDLVINGSVTLKDGYAYEFTGNDHWSQSLDDDWDQVIVSRGDTVGAREIGRRRIDGVMCAVFKAPSGALYAQTVTMARNGDVDPRDIPAHLRPAELRELPETNGSNVGYSQGGYGPKEPGWYQVEYATGSDYSGGSVTRSNYRVLGEMLEETHPEESEPVVWARTSGGHGTYGIVVRYGDLDEEIRSAIDALEDYPLLSEEAHSELEMEEQDETWENWGRSEFIGAVAKIEGKDKSALEDAITPDQWHGVFRAMCTATNRDWEDQGGEGPWIDMKKLAEELGHFIEKGEFPKHSSDYEDEALQALYDALPGVEED